MDELQETIKFISGIVTYNPNIIKLEKNIDSIFGQSFMDEIVIVDNGSKNILDIRELCDRLGVILLENTENLGIASALNRIMNKAKELGYSWVLTCDQDSILPKNMLQHFSKHIGLRNVAIISPKVFDVNSQTLIDDIISDEEFLEIDKCITSGSLNSIQSWESVGGFDEFLFIDNVDFDYCFRVRKLGLRIIRDNTVILEHELGRTKNVNFFGRTFPILNHNPTRKYYIARNRIYCDYKNKEGLKINSILYMLKSFLFILLYENNKISKLRKTFLGMLDGLRLGKKL